MGRRGTKSLFYANTSRILLGNLLGNGHHLCKYNIKVGLIKLGDEESRRMELAQGRLECQDLKLAMLDYLYFML